MTMDIVKLNRNYLLTITTPDGTELTIKPPFTMEMDITRNTLTSANVCQIRLYNLSKKNRDLIHFNAYNTSLFNKIVVNAGYGNNLGNIFAGNVSRAWSVREGTNFITQIECYDGGFAYVNGQVDMSFPVGTPLKLVILSLMQQLPNVQLGAVGNFDGVLKRSNTYSGNPAQILFEITGGAFYIDNGKAYALKNNEFNAGQPVVLVNDATGLLGTPRLEETKAIFEMIFEPSLNVGSLVVVNSTTFPAVNGTYSITAVKHRGIISESVSGNLVTQGEFFYSKNLTPVVGN